MRSLSFIVSLILVIISLQPANAQWFSQTKEDPFEDNHIVGAVTVKYGKGLIVRCVGGKDLQLMFLPNEIGSDDVVTMANLSGASIKVRIDKDAIDELQATVQLAEGKVLAIAILDRSIASRMAKSRRRIAVVFDLLGNQFGSTSFSVRGSSRHIKKVLNACPEIDQPSVTIKSDHFQTINKLKKSRYTDPKDGLRIINSVKKFIHQKPYKDKIINMSVEAAFRPHKVSVEFTLNYRLAKSELAEISQAVRDGAGSGFKRYFVGFRLEGDNGAYWATAHHDPEMKVNIIGLPNDKYNSMLLRVMAYKPNKKESIITDAILDHDFSYHLIILKTPQGYIERKFHPDGTAWGKNGEPLRKKGGRYWRVGNNFGENLVVRGGFLEIHDRDGLVTKAKITKRKGTFSEQGAMSIIKTAIEKCDLYPEKISRIESRSTDQILKEVAHIFEAGKRSKVKYFKIPTSDVKKRQFLRKLYTQLQNMRKNRNFKRYGFAANPGKTWLTKLNALRDDQAFNLWLLQNCEKEDAYCSLRLPGTLIGLGMDYNFSRSAETHSTCKQRVAWDQR